MQRPWRSLRSVSASYLNVLHINVQTVLKSE